MSENDYLSFFFFFCWRLFELHAFIATNKSSQITDLSDMRDKTTQGSRLSRVKTTIKKKKFSFNTSLAVIHCPRLQSQSHTHNAQNKPESWKLANLGYNLQVWIFAVLNLLSTLSRLRLKCNSYKIFIYSLLLNMLCLFLNLFFWFSLSF